MNQVIEILTSLGINETVYYQFGIFFVAYISMSYIVFKPYLRALQERQNRTEGGQQLALRFLEEAQKKEDQYKVAAKKLNGEISQIFAVSSAKAKAEGDEIINTTKNQIEGEIAKDRKELEAAVAEARKDLDQHIPDISKNIQKKFIGQ